MRLHEKIRLIRKQERKLTLKQFHSHLTELFGKDALSYKTLVRIEKGLTTARPSSLFQICVGLGITLKELKEGTEEAKSTLVDIIRKNKRYDRYVYNDKSYTEMLISTNRRFFAGELVLQPQGKTRTEEDPIETTKFEKWVYCLAGKVSCVIGTERHTLEKGDCLSFESSIPHSFENPTSKKARLIVVQNPRSI